VRYVGAIGLLYGYRVSLDVPLTASVTSPYWLKADLRLSSVVVVARLLSRMSVSISHWIMPGGEDKLTQCKL
jgi:hypothetical protein